MQKRNLKIILSAVAGFYLLVSPVHNACADSWSLTSPDGRCGITVTLNKGELSYHVAREGKIVIRESAIGLQRDDEQFESGLTFKHAGRVEAQREKYELFASTQPQVDHLLNHLALEFCNTNHTSIKVDLAAGNEGVAFRYLFPGHSSIVRVVDSELTSFAIPTNASGWMQPYHAAGPYTPAYEDFFFAVAPGDPPPDSRQRALGWAFPALFHVAEADTWVLLTEAGTDPAYCACHLSTNCAGGIYRIAFPMVDETTRGYTNQFGPEPRYTLPWTMPWRVMVLGQSAGDIATETLVTDLSASSRIKDTSWIHPGRASWGWWSYPDGPFTEKMFDQFTDFAAKMGWEYTLFDAGWWKPGLKPIAAHAIAKGIMPLVWNYAADFYDPQKRAMTLDKMAAAGIHGVKVDFWCSDRQEAIVAQQALMKDASERHMIVNLHGCTIPRGWQRTWPNVLSMEAVLGDESYFYEPRYTQKAAELNTVLPFTRNAVGPMDLTPVAVSPKKYQRTTTAAHELAASIIFTSGIIHYADSPEFFGSLPPDVLQIFRDAPARWDETHCLAGKPGELAVFARRSGDCWFIAGINGTADPKVVTMDLSAFHEYRHRFAVTEAVDAKMQVDVTHLDVCLQWQHYMPARGGFILRLNK